MKRRHCAAYAALVCLLVCGIDSRTTCAQENGGGSFFSTLSYDAYAGGIYNAYHGNAVGARLAIPLFSLPTLNGLFSPDQGASGDLLLLPGVKYGSIKAGGDPLAVRVLYFAPELSLHYSFLRFSRLSFMAGPSVEFIYTNNSKAYLAVPAAGVDLGMGIALSDNFQIGLEQRWIMSKPKNAAVNVADFPQRPFSNLALMLRFSLPWKAEETGRAELRSEYEQRRSESEAGAEAEQEALRSRHAAETDSLRAHVRELEAKLAQTAKKAPVETARVDRFDAAAVVGDPLYVFTRDPFKAGNLVNDGYLKNVLLDILDDEYVWELRAKKSRMHDAEKIRAYFTLYNTTLGRRIVLAEDESVRLFTLKCLGKALVLGTE